MCIDPQYTCQFTLKGALCFFLTSHFQYNLQIECSFEPHGLQKYLNPKTSVEKKNESYWTSVCIGNLQTFPFIRILIKRTSVRSAPIQSFQIFSHWRGLMSDLSYIILISSFHSSSVHTVWQLLMCVLRNSVSKSLKITVKYKV